MMETSSPLPFFFVSLSLYVTDVSVEKQTANIFHLPLRGASPPQHMESFLCVNKSMLSTVLTTCYFMS